MIKADIVVHNLTESKEDYKYLLYDTVYKVSTPDMLNYDDFEKWLSLAVNSLLIALKESEVNND